MVFCLIPIYKSNREKSSANKKNDELKLGLLHIPETLFALTWIRVVSKIYLLNHLLHLELSTRIIHSKNIFRRNNAFIMIINCGIIYLSRQSKTGFLTLRHIPSWNCNSRLRSIWLGNLNYVASFNKYWTYFWYYNSQWSFFGIFICYNRLK